MTSTPSNASVQHLFSLLHHDRTGALEAPADMQAWGRELVETLAQLAPEAINQTNQEGRTPLSVLVRARNAWHSVTQAGVQALLDAGANPLAGEECAWAAGNPFTDNPAMQLMTCALVEAQQAGSPLLDDAGGNALHVFAERNIGSLMALVTGNSPLAEHIPAGVFAEWRDQERELDGLRPTTLAWTLHPGQNSAASQDGAQAALWQLLRPGQRSLWEPPSLDEVDGHGRPLWMLVEDRVLGGAVDVGRHSDIWTQVQALREQQQMEQTTAAPQRAAVPGMKRL